MNNFIAYEVSLALIESLRELVPNIQRHDRDLADQIHRAATSVALNLAEGSRRNGGDKRRHFEIAHGSANEVRAGLDVAAAWGWIVDAQRVREIIDRQLALLWRLTNGRAADTFKGAPVRDRKQPVKPNAGA